MEVTPVSYLEITLHNSEECNEVQQFMDLMRRVYVESARPGLKNTFEKDRPIIKKLVENLNILVEKEDVKVTAGDTHTRQEYNEGIII